LKANGVVHVMLRQSSKRLSISLLNNLYGRSSHQYIKRTFSRNAATAVDQHVEQTTLLALDRRQTPLGTMTANQIGDTIAAAMLWCSQQGRGLSSAELLAHRLGLELASGSQTARKFTHEVVTMNLQLIQAYCDTDNDDSYNGQSDDKTANLDDAERLLRRLVSWYQRGTVHDLPADIVVKLVRAWVARGDEERASELLFWWTDLFPDNQDVLLPVFQSVVVASFHADNQAVMKNLSHKLQELRRKHGWKGTEDLLYGKIQTTAPDEVFSSTSVEDGNDGRISDKAHNVKSKMMEFLKNASKEDIGKVLKFEDKILRIPNFELTLDLCESLLDYYLRVKAPRQSATWLQRLDRFGATYIFDKVPDVLTLLADSNEVASPWRAAELFKRMEQLEEQGEGIITTEMYHACCKIWAQSDEAVARRKVQEILIKQVSASKDGHSFKIPTAETFDLLFSFLLDDLEGARTVFQFVVSQFKFSDKALLKEKVGTLLPKLVGFGLVDEASTLLRLARESDCRFDDDTLSRYVVAHIHSPEPLATFAALDLVKRLEGHAPFDCYEKAILGFLAKRGRGSPVKERALLETVLKGLYDGTLLATTPQSRNFLEKLTTTLRRQGRRTEAENILLYFEKAHDGSARIDLLTIECFNNVMIGWSNQSKFDRVQAIFDRLIRYSQSDHEHLAPDRKSFSLYLKALSKLSNSAQRAEKQLLTMLSRCTETGQQELKPDDGHFNSVLIALKNEAPRDVVDRCMTLLQLMKEQEIRPEPFTFDTVMNAILVSSDDRKFSKVMLVRQLMKEAKVEPSNFTYNIILNSCSYASEGESELALNTAIQTVKRLRESTPAGPIVYTTYAKVLKNLLKKRDKRKVDAVAEAIQFCREDGALDETLAGHFRSLLRNG
jgi:hypothetical protein